MKKQIYSGYAFTENAQEKSKINRKIYDEIKNKARVKLIGVGYAHAKYKIVENKENLSNAELALICDTGNLCFGYRLQGNYIVILTD